MGVLGAWAHLGLASWVFRCKFASLGARGPLALGPGHVAL